MLPDRNLLGQIEAIQVRLDKVYNQKFYNLTSVDQYYGTQSKCCPHYVGVHEGDEVVCLTEGVMKSDLAYSFAQGSPYECGFVGLTGIPSYSQYERALEELDSIGVKRINVMVDSDYQVKEEVRKARDRYIEMGAAAGLKWHRLPGHKSKRVWMTFTSTFSEDNDLRAAAGCCSSLH